MFAHHIFAFYKHFKHINMKVDVLNEFIGFMFQSVTLPLVTIRAIVNSCVPLEKKTGIPEVMFAQHLSFNAFYINWERQHATLTTSAF